MTRYIELPPGVYAGCEAPHVWRRRRHADGGPDHGMIYCDRLTYARDRRSLTRLIEIREAVDALISLEIHERWGSACGPIKWSEREVEE